ncbi:MAG: hypothetical protein KDD62_00505 [Bdellovibrionales bacterium]|nr:hypothetical protein [Bdellovibrionales bacterium]
MKLFTYTLFACVVAISPLAGGLFAEEPALPLGLDSSEPSLPSGLDSKALSEEPELPMGLDDDLVGSSALELEGRHDTSPVSYRGFLETRGGLRVYDDPTQKTASIGEVRLQTQFDKEYDWISGRITSDLVADAVANTWPLDLETGEGFVDLREAFVFARLGENADVKVGRQVLTWGTGDFLFINDLFPKDWNSFFIGRDDEYLKAPSDALKVSLFSEVVNIDLVYTPVFDSDRYIDGQRISFFNPAQAAITGRDQPLEVSERTRWFQDDELSARIYRRLGSYELALYGYYGFWKSPGGFDPKTMEATFPRLAVYGASLRGPFLSGIGNLEVGYYDSLDDSDGKDPLVRNSELRALAGYEQEIAQNLTAGIQYYVEAIQDYEGYRAQLPESLYLQDEYRQLVTLRLTQLLMNQNLLVSFFGFYSPTDDDAFPRAKVNYKLSDSLQVEFGSNFFLATDRRSFFGMFEDNSNVYTAIRYGFVS